MTRQESIPINQLAVADCHTCLDRLQSSLRTLNGVQEVERDERLQTLVITYDENLVSVPELHEHAQVGGQQIGAQFQHLLLPIVGLDCADCARTLEAGVAQLPGVQSSVLNFANATLAVEYDGRKTSPSQLINRLHELGYEVTLEELTFELEGMDCADCAVKLQEAVSRLPMVIEARVVFATAQLHVKGASTRDLTQAVLHRVSELGYSARLPETVEATAPGAKREWRHELYRQRRLVLTAVSGLFLGTAFVLDVTGFEVASIVAYVLSMLAGGYYVAKSGLAVLRTTRSMDMNALMTIAAVGAVAIGEWSEGATAIFLFSLGNSLESLTMDRARQAIRKLIELAPKSATRVHGEHTDQVPVEQLRVGDVVIVPPNERIPMDGVVEQGSSAVNQAPITGESQPVDVSPGSPVYAATINGPRTLFVRVTKLARDNTLARIVQMVQEAQGRRAPSQRFVDMFAKYYTPAVIVIAALIAIVPPLLIDGAWITWISRALVLLVISCPCSLVISTPVSIVSAISNAARHGILVKGGSHLEDIARIRAIALDKTGTLSVGRPVVTDLELVNGRDLLDVQAATGSTTEDRLLSLAAAIEGANNHPIAQAIVNEARRRGLAVGIVPEHEELAGSGARARIDSQTFYVGSHRLFTERVPHPLEVCQRVEQLEAEGKTAVLVGTDKQVLGMIAVADQVREESAALIDALKRLGVGETILLTGDNERTARALASVVGIDDVRANLLPQDKVTAVEDLLEQKGAVAMVGDGVNDAPALARATVGIAMGAVGTEAALETADIVLMSDELQRIPYVIALGRQTLETIQQNIVLSLVIKGVFLLLAVAGLATLWMAVFADVGTSLIVILNGMRLLREDRIRV